MIYREYKNFDEAFFEFNREILLNPGLIEAMCNTMGGLHQVIMEIPSPKCDRIDLGMLGYNEGKWRHLVGTYLGPEKVEELRHLGEKVTGLSYTFYFLQKSTHNGSCMTSMDISRDKRGTPWNTVTVKWRTTELQRRWGADLILIARMAELIPNANITRFQFQMTSAYQSAMYVVPNLGYFGVKAKNLDPKAQYTKMVLRRKELYYDPDKSPHKMLASAQRLIEFHKKLQSGWEPPKITYKECTL